MRTESTAPVRSSLLVASVALLVALLASPAILAEETAPQPPAAADQSDAIQDRDPVDDPDADDPADADGPGVDDDAVPLRDAAGRPLGTEVPDGGPGEPPPIVEDEDPGLDAVEDTTSFGTFFVTTFSFSSAYDQLSFDENAPPPLPVPVRPGAPPQLPPTSLDPSLSEDGEVSYLVHPSFLFVRRPSSRSGLVVAYRPEIETLQEGDGDERVSHSAGVLWERRSSRRTDLTAGASYVDTLDPTRHFGGEGLVLVPGRFEQSRIFFGASHLWNRATRLHFYTELSTATSAIERIDTALDVADVSGTISLEQGVGRSSDVSLSYSYTKTELDGLDSLALGPALDGPSDAVRLGFGHSADAISFNISGGVVREETFEGEEDLSWIGGLEVARDREPLRYSFRYDHSLFAFGYGTAVEPGIGGPLVSGVTLANTEADTISFHLGYDPQARVRFEQSLWLARESVIENDEFGSFVSTSTVEVALTGKSVHRLMLFSTFDYYERERSAFLGGALSRTRFSLGFRVGLTGPQTKVGQRAASTEMRKVLPIGGRL